MRCSGAHFNTLSIGSDGLFYIAGRLKTYTQTAWFRCCLRVLKSDFLIGKRPSETFQTAFAITISGMKN
jgi:hypothetical protein